jgi:hypothetical protein
MENRAGMAPVDGGVPGALDNAVLAAFSGPPDPSRARVSEVLLVITVVMVILAARQRDLHDLGNRAGRTAIALSLAAIPARIGARRCGPGSFNPRQLDPDHHSSAFL